MIYHKEDFILNYWNYFLLLEDEFISIEKIIPIDDINNKVFSFNYMKLYFSLCSEVDVILKEFIVYNGWFKFTRGDGNFGRYKEIILKEEPNFSNEIVVFSETKNVIPFNSWNRDSKPTWWEDYNDIKHNRVIGNNRSENYKKANQENIINAFCALYQIEMYFYKSIIDRNKYNDKLRMPVPQSKRIRIKNWCDNIALIDNRYILYVTEEGNLYLEGAIN